MDPIRHESVVPFTVPITSDHGADAVTDPTAAVIPRNSPTDTDFQPAAFDGTAITFSVGPGTPIGTLNPGRNWIFVRFLDGGQPVELPAGTVDVDLGPVVTADEIAGRLQLPTPIPDTTRAALDAAIRDATADVTAYLGRPPTPRYVTETHVRPLFDGRWDVHEWPVLTVLSAVEETATDGYPLGTYTVTYLAGLDAANDPELEPIRRYITAAVENSPRVLTLWRAAAGAAARVVTSLSVEGQTVGYTAATLGGGGDPGSGAPGALPKIESLSRWKVRGRRAFQRPGIAPDPLDWMGTTLGRPWWR